MRAPRPRRVDGVAQVQASSAAGAPRPLDQTCDPAILPPFAGFCRRCPRKLGDLSALKSTLCARSEPVIANLPSTRCDPISICIQSFADATRQQLTVSPQKEETSHFHSSSMQRGTDERSEGEEQ